MGPTTPEEREDLILKTIEKSDGIGFNQLQTETGIPKKTLDKYLKDLMKDKIITRTMKGKKRSNGVTYTVNFSEHTKKAIKHNLAQISQFNLSFYDTKYRKSNTFPHLLQGLAAEYYQNMMSFLFDNVPAYKFGVKRIEEFLDTEKKRLDKEFNRKNKVRLNDACQEVQFVLSDNSWSALLDAETRTMHRTRDEVRIDCINIPHQAMNSPSHIDENDKKHIKPKWGLENSRVDLIEDKRIKKLFIELTDEYDRLSEKLRNIQYRLAGITGAFAIKPPT